MALPKDQWPSPIEPSNLREHFATTYRLNAHQVEVMLLSSAKSLKTTLAELQEAIEDNLGYREISRLAHSLKGVLLNMGELEWAELARRLEKAGEAEEQINYRDLVCVIGNGVEKFLKSADIPETR